MFRQVSRVVVVVLVAVSSVAVATAAGPKEADSKAKSPPKELTVDLGKGIKLELVLIPAGEFLMGSPESDKDAYPSEKPQHRVRITRPFYMGEYLVTQEQWETVMGNNPSYFKGPKNPVETVSWDDCQTFLGKLNARSAVKGGKFVLPTEAQWEYACRAGSTTRFCFGDDEAGLGEYAWYGGRLVGGQTHPVGEKKPNAWGLFDIHGNVWECCQDRYAEGYYKESPVDDPAGPTEGSRRVGRGGGWVIPAAQCRSADRDGIEPGDRSHDMGFRVSLVPAEAAEPKVSESKVSESKQITNSIGMKLTLVPSGEFEMGSGESAEETRDFIKNFYGKDFTLDSFDDEHPQHRVRITKPFYLGTYHVTRGQFRQFVIDTSYKTDAEKGGKPGAFGWDPDKRAFGFNEKYSWRNAGFEQTDEHPVVNVSWNDAVEFCKWLSKKDNKTYRLPTEAEWEYACRAGTTTRYSNGDDPETLARVANVIDATFHKEFPDYEKAIYPRNTINANDGYVFTSPVGQFKPNAFGLYDMHGNAQQWCADWYGDDYYGKSPVNDPRGPSRGENRVFRGGAWCRMPYYSRSAARLGFTPDYRFNYVGFRVAKTQ